MHDEPGDGARREGPGLAPEHAHQHCAENRHADESRGCWVPAAPPQRVRRVPGRFFAG